MERKNVALLILCQALAMTSMTVLFMVAALIGNGLAMDKSLATLPLTLLQLAVMVITIPASLLMRRIGRKLGFWHTDWHHWGGTGSDRCVE